MIKVLSTGELPEGLQHYASLNGLSVDVIPFIRTKHSLNTGKIAIIKKLSTEQQTAILTSKNAVQVIASILKNTPNWEFYCIDGATLKNIKSYWGASQIKGIASNGKALANIMVTDTNQKRISSPIVFFCGSRRLNTIPETLSMAKIPYKEIVVYDTVETPIMVNDVYDAILFYSPSEVHSFFSRNKTNNAILFSIGETTSEALVKFNILNNPIITSEQAGKAKMIDLIINYFNEKNEKQTKK